MAGLPMKVYGSSVESPQVVRFSSLVQKRAPVTRHVLQMSRLLPEGDVNLTESHATAPYLRSAIRQAVLKAIVPKVPVVLKARA